MSAVGAGPARVVLTGGLSRRYTGGVLKELDRLHPGLADHLEHETTVAIDGAIHEDVGYYQTVKPGSEIFFIPKLEGG